MGNLTVDSQRLIALSAARTQLEKSVFTRHDIERTVSYGQALDSLDDLIREQPDHIASQWYSHASPTQIRKFYLDRIRYQKVFTQTDYARSELDKENFEPALKLLDKYAKHPTITK